MDSCKCAACFIPEQLAVVLIFRIKKSPNSKEDKKEEYNHSKLNHQQHRCQKCDTLVKVMKVLPYIENATAYEMSTNDLTVVK